MSTVSELHISLKMKELGETNVIFGSREHRKLRF